jgi:transglutaminase-like putative cysteine protease
MAENILRLIRWTVNKIGAGTLVGLVLLLVLLSSVVWWLNQFSGRFASPSLGSTTLLALLLGWLLARSRLPGWLAAILAALAGLMVVVLLVGELVSPLLALAQSIFSLMRELRFWRPGQPLPDESLILVLAQDLGLRLADLALRALFWARRLLRGASGFDAQAAGLVWGLVLWCAAAWASWGVRRRDQPLLAALPAVGIAAASLAFAREQLFYLVPAFGATLGLLAWSQYTRRSQDWQRQSVDYATDIPFDLTLWAGAIVVGVGGLALVAAIPSPHQAVRLTRSLLVTRSQTAENLGQSLGLSPGTGLTQPVGKAGLLPRLHLLGSGPELSQRVIYLVRVLEPSGQLAASSITDLPVEGHLYWRAVAYDVYDGRGWSTSPTTANAYAGGEGPPLPEQLGTYYWIEQEIQAVGDAGRQVVQAGDLYRLDQPFTTDQRTAPPDELDVFGARLDRPPSAGEYRAVSGLLAPSQEELTAAGYDYPLWVAARYLALPPDLPPRLQELANDITAGKATPYERAKAIEAYLRLIPYTLDVPAPPPGRDVADYYLFDLRRGYCDYAATAMAVMARAVGLPSRLVVGYAPGSYDPDIQRVVITEAEAHSWPEIYFSDVGWVRFEPTGGRAPSLLPEPPASVTASEPPALSAEPAQPGLLDSVWLALAGLVVLVLAAWGWYRWRLAWRSGAEALTVIYTQLRRLGRRLGAPDYPGLTPAEVAAGVDSQVKRLEESGRWMESFAPIGDETRRLVALYMQAIYSPYTPNPAEVNAARALWWKLRWRFWLFTLAPGRRDISHSDSSD